MKTKCLLASLALGLGMTLAFLWLLVAGSLIPVYADTYTVTNTNPSGPGSLRQAILDANGNPGHDSIDFGITGTIVLTDALPAISDDLTITGPGAEQLAVSGDNQFGVFEINGSTAVTVTGLVVRDGRITGNGGGIHNNGTLLLQDMQVVSNSAQFGGGIYVEFGSATLSRTQVVSNSASRDGGGVYVYEGSATLSETQVVSNSASYGGGVYVDLNSATLNVRGGKINSNSASREGGGIYNKGTLLLQDMQVVSNSAFGPGGGVYVSSSSGVSLNKTQMVSNSASFGGGIYVSYGSVTLSGTQVVNNSVSSYGGGVYVSSTGATLNASGGIIDSNSASRGGGVYVSYGSVTLSGTQVVNNSATENGGGVHVDWTNATLNVSGGIIDNNSATHYGGGVYVYYGRTTLNGTRIIANDAITGSGLYLSGVGAVTATNGCIVLNSDIAVDSTDGIPITATDNWWGAADGPGGAGPGSGDTVSADVDYANFKTVAPTGCPSRVPGYGSDPAPGTTINVGMVNMGSTVSTTLTIRETGAATLVVTPTLSGVNAGDFGIAPSTTFTIADGGAVQKLTISCTPSVTGTLGTLVRTLAATLTVVHNAPDSPAVYPLRCIGGALRYVYLPLVLRNN